MKKIIFIFGWILSLPIFPGALQADPPLISANGFSCVKSQNLVTCQGQFPGVPGVLSASGTFGVQLTYESQGNNRNRFIFDSTTGCLMQIGLDGLGQPTQVNVKNALGSTQTFLLPAMQMQAFQFCKS